MSTFSARIRRARQKAGFTQGQLALKVGVQRGAVSQWERADGTLPAVANMCQIAVVTQVSFEWLATGRGGMRVSEPHQTAALVASEFAHNDMESRLLVAIRRLRNPRRRQAIVAMVEGLTS